MESNYQLILGSKSPRRIEILEKAGFHFVHEVYEVDEIYPKRLVTNSIAEFLANKKSDGFRHLHAHELLITCDTIVVVENTILEKPKDAQHALEMLQLLQGKEHQVYSGVCLRSLEKRLSFTDKTDVKFVAFSDKELKYYIEQFKPFDKAGSYGVQDWIGIIGVEYIRGSFYNVMGLPMHKLYQELLNF